MKPMFFDIETVARPFEDMFYVSDEDIPLGNTTDPDKVAVKKMEHKLNWQESGALRPETGQVAMVGFWRMGHEKPLILECGKNSEHLLLATTVNYIKEQLMAGGHLVGFCCKTFDLPFLIRRCWVKNVPIGYPLRGHRLWDDNIVDLWDIWCLGDRSPVKGTTTMEAVARQLGLPPKLGRGEDFAKMTDQQRTEYLTRDLEITKGIYERICL